MGAGHLAGGPGGGAGGDAVVDDQGQPVLQGDPRPVAAQPLRPGLQLGAAGPLQLLHLVAGEPGAGQHVPVDDEDAVLADRPDRQLGLERHPELADQDHVERRAQSPGDLEGHGDTAPRQAQDDGVLVAVGVHGACQLTAGVGTVLEHHGGHLPVTGRPLHALPDRSPSLGAFGP